jgi:hypothetical protein
MSAYVLLAGAIFLLGFAFGGAFGMNVGQAIAEEERQREDDSRLSSAWLRTCWSLERPSGPQTGPAPVLRTPSLAHPSHLRRAS